MFLLSPRVPQCSRSPTVYTNLWLQKLPPSVLKLLPQLQSPDSDLLPLTTNIECHQFHDSHGCQNKISPPATHRFSLIFSPLGLIASFYVLQWSVLKSTSKEPKTPMLGVRHVTSKAYTRRQHDNLNARLVNSPRGRQTAFHRRQQQPTQRMPRIHPRSC